MMPISLYNAGINLERYACRRNLLVVSLYDSDRLNYEKFLWSQFPSSQIDSGDYSSLHNQLANSNYDVLILDNDAFLVDKNPALECLARSKEFIDKDRIIVTASIPQPDLVQRVISSGARFVEKGKWKTLAETIKELAKQNKLYNLTA